MFEKKNGKRFLGSVMALVMLLSLAPVGALAVEGEAQNRDVVTQLADGDNQQAVVDEDNNTPTANPPWTPSPWWQTPWRATPKQSFSRKGTCSTRLLA